METRGKLSWLDPRDPEQAFPDPAAALTDPGGLLAIGGDLSPARLIRAYRNGIFPWYNPDEPILWWSPDPRTVLRPATMHRSRSLLRCIRREEFAVTADHCYAQVIRRCAQPRAKQPGTWLGPDMLQAFMKLHELGHAHSVEVWHKGQLVGGIYGVVMGRIFFGESMFSRRPNASKLAMHYLCRQLQAWKFPLIDCQVSSSHLQSLGAIEMPRERFLEQVREYRDAESLASRWVFDVALPQSPDHLPSIKA